MEKQEYEKLKNRINYHMDRYYNLDAPEISDYAYDQLMLQLKDAEKEHPEWITPDSPTQKIGGRALRDGEAKVTHNVPMLSIEDVFDKESVRKWVAEVHALHPDAQFSVEQKIDGLSMTLRYRRLEGVDGKMKLELAETRGDGFVGDDVTLNAEVIPDVPAYLELPYEYLEVRGEVYMSHEDFARYNEIQEKAGKPTAANPRNLAAGTLRLLDPAVVRKRGLRMFVFNVQDGPSEIMERHDRAMDLLAARGLPTVYHRLCDTAEEVLATIDEIGEMRDQLPYDIDGAVVKIDQTAYRADFPEGSKYTDGHIAYKYPPEERIVTMDEIIVDVGRTGKLTFTGKFHDSETGKPARLCGTSVSRATLHNQDYIRGMSIGIGGQYRLFKSGEIIPKLNGCVKEPEKIFEAPANCPVCGQPLIREEDTADIRCINPSCPAQLTRTISWFASRPCMDIAGLGETIIDALVKHHYLQTYADLYGLKEKRDELIGSGIIGREKNTDKVLAAIDASRSNPPERLLAGLGIRNVGVTTSRALMRHYHSIPELMQADEEELTGIPDIGSTIAKDIVLFFRNENNRKVIGELEAYGVNMTSGEADETSEKLKGLTIVITGKLPTLSRNEMKALIENNGGKCTGSVSGKTDYLVAGEDGGSKLDRAAALGIPVISEEELLKMLEE